MRRSIRTTAIAALTAASILAGPALAAQAHGGGARGTKGTKSASTAASHKAHVVSALVTAGTITTAQGVTVNAAIKASTAPRSTTDAERRTKYTAIMAPIVANATITQAQVDALVNAIVVDGAANAPRVGTKAKGSRGTKSSTTVTTIKAA